MAETETAERSSTSESQGNGGNGDHGRGRTVARAAAIAAATGATAIAAKRALSDRGGGADGDQGGGEKTKQRKGGDSVVTSVLSSGWDSARDSIVPMLEDAASSAGEYIARSGPELVTETIVPQFIRGFERGRKSSSSNEDSD